MRSVSEFTRVLERIGAGDASARAELIPIVYDRLHAMAGAMMRQERRNHTLTATVLVNDLYMAFFGPGAVATFESEAHFYNAAATAMRRHLIDHARARMAQKRGGPGEHLAGQLPCPVPLAEIAEVAELDSRADPEDTIRLVDALGRLEERDPQAAAVVHMRFLCGRSVEHTAALLGISESTVKRDWQFARAWLLGELRAG